MNSAPNLFKNTAEIVATRRANAKAVNIEVLKSKKKKNKQKHAC